MLQLPRCTHRFPGSTLRMPAPTGEGWLTADAFAIVATVFGAFCNCTGASRMGTFVRFLASHDPSPLPLQYHLQEADAMADGGVYAARN